MLQRILTIYHKFVLQWEGERHETKIQEDVLLYASVFISIHWVPLTFDSGWEKNYKKMWSALWRWTIALMHVNIGHWNNWWNRYFIYTNEQILIIDHGTILWSHWVCFEYSDVNKLIVLSHWSLRLNNMNGLFRRRGIYTKLCPLDCESSDEVSSKHG